MDTVYAIVLNSGPSSVELIFDWISKIAILAATIVGVIAAFFGISAWKKQLKGTHEYELAKGFLKSALYLRNEIDAFRSPMMLAGEIYSAAKEKGIEIGNLHDFMELKSDELVYDRRWKGIVGKWNLLEEKNIEGEVLWGSQFKSYTDELSKKMMRLKLAMDNHFRYKNSPTRQSSANQEKNEKILMAMGTEEDPDLFGESIRKIFHDIEEFLKPKIK